MEVSRFVTASTTVLYFIVYSELYIGISFIHHSSFAGGIDEFDVQFVSKLSPTL